MKKIRLNEKQLINIISNIILEQNNVDPDRQGFLIAGNVTELIKMGENLFDNGVDTINTNSAEFNAAIKALQNLIRTTKKDNLTITVEGGASSVGSERYDNKALAAKRANNFIRAIKPKFKNLNFNVTTKVGNATKKDSKEAKAQQYVKLFYGNTSTVAAGYYEEETKDRLELIKRVKPASKEEIANKKIEKFEFLIPQNFTNLFLVLAKLLNVQYKQELTNTNPYNKGFGGFGKGSFGGGGAGGKY